MLKITNNSRISEEITLHKDETRGSSYSFLQRGYSFITERALAILGFSNPERAQFSSWYTRDFDLVAKKISIDSISSTSSGTVEYYDSLEEFDRSLINFPENVLVVIFQNLDVTELEPMRLTHPVFNKVFKSNVSSIVDNSKKRYLVDIILRNPFFGTEKLKGKYGELAREFCAPSHSTFSRYGPFADPRWNNKLQEVYTIRMVNLLIKITRLILEKDLLEKKVNDLAEGFLFSMKNVDILPELSVWEKFMMTMYHGKPQDGGKIWERSLFGILTSEENLESINSQWEEARTRQRRGTLCQNLLMCEQDRIIDQLFYDHV